MKGREGKSRERERERDRRGEVGKNDINIDIMNIYIYIYNTSSIRGDNQSSHARQTNGRHCIHSTYKCIIYIHILFM